MPVRNAEPFLSECIESIINQTETNWELLAIDDGSTDASHATLLHYAAKDDRVSVFKNNGRGIIDALRLAFTKSNGNLITRMDADDRMAPSKLEVLKRNLLSHGTGHIAVGAVRYFSETTLGNGYRMYQEWLNALTATGGNYSDIYKECVIPSPCWMVYSNDLVNCGAFDSDTYPEDYDLCFRFYRQQLKPIACTDVLHWWRDHPMRSSRNDAHYADNRFLQLKLNWFLELDRDTDRPLILWGAGAKGKALASILLENGIGFEWVCNNPKKIGHIIYGVEMRSEQLLSVKHNPQVIVSVANPQEQLKLKNVLAEQALFFC